MTSRRRYPVSIRLDKSPEELRAAFGLLATDRDLAELLDVPYERFIYHVYRGREQAYRAFEVPKRRGGSRQIHAPVTALKLIQKKLAQVLSAVYAPKASTHGFVTERGVRSNALRHAGTRYVLNLDLKDFFPSISARRVRAVLMHKPYGLPKEVATAIAHIACFEGRLPQGAPSSPVLSNIVCRKLDRDLQQLAADCRAVYTRYADDITFSTTLRAFPSEIALVTQERDIVKLDDLAPRLSELIHLNGFEVNPDKVRLQTKRERQEVTGVIVNAHPNVPRAHILTIRVMLHRWKTKGLAQAQAEYEARLPSGNLSSGHRSRFENVLRGKIAYVGTVKGKDDPVYRKYRRLFEDLAAPLSIARKT